MIAERNTDAEKIILHRYFDYCTDYSTLTKESLQIIVVCLNKLCYNNTQRYVFLNIPTIKQNGG